MHIVTKKIRDIFGAANILVWYCVPGCTDLIQPIDAGIGRSIRIYVGHDLDKWLSVDDNLEAWEDRLCAKDRRILMTNLLAGAMSNILSDEKKNVRIGSFARTGCLIELTNRRLSDGTNTDDVIKPQGLTGKYSIPSLDIVDEDVDLETNVPDETIPESDIDNFTPEEVIDLLNHMVEFDQSANVTINVENILPEGIDVFDNNEEGK